MSFSDFFDRLGDLDYLAVLVGAIVFMVVGYIWYGPLFGRQWSAASGQPMESGMPATDKLIAMFVSMFVFSAAINYLGVTDNFDHAIVAGLVLGVFVIGAAAYTDVIWAGKNRATWMIDTVYLLVAITLVYYVQGLIV